MASHKVVVKTTFEQIRAIEPFYTGGEIVADESGNFAACTVDEEDCLIVSLRNFHPLCRIEGDGEAITSLAITPKSTHVIVCSRSLSVRFYQLAHQDNKVTATLARTIKPHSTPVVASCADSSGSLLATGGAEGVVKVWDIYGGYCSHTFHSHGGVVTALSFMEISPRAKKEPGFNRLNHMETNGDRKSLFLASGGEDGKIKIHDLDNRKQIATLDSHVSLIRSLTFSSAAQILLSASRDKTLVLWDVHKWSAKKIITATEELEAAGFFPDGQNLFAGGESGRVRVWRLDGRELDTDQESTSSAESLSTILSVPSRYSLIVVRNDQTLETISYQNLEARAHAGQPALLATKLHSGNHDEVIDMAYIGNSLLAIADNTEIVKLLSTATNEDEGFGKSLDTLQGHSDVVICLDVDPHGRWLVTGSKDNTARLWHRATNSSTFDCHACLAGHTASIGAVSLQKSVDKYKTPQYLITGSEDKTVKKWDLSKLRDGQPVDDAVVKAVFTRVAHEKDINAIDVCSGTSLFASASQDRTIKIWSAEDGSTAAVLKGHKRGVWSIKFSPAGAPALNLAEGGSSGNRGLLVSGSGDNTVKVWSMNTYTCLLTFEGHQNSVLKVLWVYPQDDQSLDDAQSSNRRDRPMIASASSDTLIKLWSPYVSADGDHLLTTIDGHSDRVWSLATPSLTSSASQSPDSKVPYSLISGAADAKVVFWADTTAATTTQNSKERNDRIEQDQLLQNHIFAKNYKEVVTLALALNHPGRLLRVFEDVVSLPINEKDEGSFTGLNAMDEVLASLNQKQVYQLLERIRDWNTNGRTATVSQKILNCLLRTYPADFWLDLAQDREILRLARGSRKQKLEAGGNAMKDLLRALEAYTDKHFRRMEDLIDETYLLEYTLREMDEVSITVHSFEDKKDIMVAECVEGLSV